MLRVSKSGLEDVMSDFLELETDAAAIAAFVARENSKTEDLLVDDAFERDVERAATLIEDPNTLPGMVRRGEWIYTYKQSEANPRGVWLRIKDGVEPSPEADWEPVFDLDAFCEETGAIWHWGGAVTARFDPNLVLLRLSEGGSDQTRHMEFDCTAKAFVAGGFDLGPERSDAAWVDRDTILWGTASGGVTTSGWQKVIKRVARGADGADAPVAFEVSDEDLLAAAYVLECADGSLMECFARIPAIGMEELTVRRAGQPDLILPNPKDTQVSHNTTHFAYVVQREGGETGAVKLGRIGETDVREVFTPAPRKSAEDMMFLRDWLVWKQMDNMRPSLMVLDLRVDDAQPVEVALPIPADSFGVGFHDSEPVAGEETLSIQIAGFTTSPCTYVFDLKNGVDGIEWRKFYQSPEGFDASGLEVQLLEARSDDGTMVPYHLVKHKDAPDDVPVMMYGYGGFGVSLAPWYDRITGKLWMEKGGAYVLAYIRGGAEFGPDWHLTAKGAGRTKSFEDFSSVARDLVGRGISKPDRIACHGGSNGGLLCGVMLTRYPEHFGAVWASVGVHDMLRFHLFPAGPGWIDEYGDPEDAEARAWLEAYSPMHNVAEASEVTYPAALIDTSASDDRVDPSHSRRFAARLHEAGHGSLFYQHGDGGHGGGGASRAQARELAIGYSFLRTSLKLDAPS